MVILHEDQYTFMIIPCSVLLRMRNVLGKSHTENHNTPFMFNNFFPRIVQFMRKVEKYGGAIQATDDMIRHISFELRITEATDTNSEHVILDVFPWQTMVMQISYVMWHIHWVSCFHNIFVQAAQQYSSLWPIKCDASHIIYPLVQNSCHNAIFITGSPWRWNVWFSHDLYFCTL